ncbi:MAG: GDP-L-fucose synthase [Patescibacteria group bacterium]|jgi:GDP-L-fucose synthase
MNKNSKIYLAGHQGLVGSAILRKLSAEGFTNLILKTREQVDLFDQRATEKFMAEAKPEYVILAAARVGGIGANVNYGADFLYENLLIQNNVIWSALKSDVKKLLFLGSSCIYPRQAKQPMKEEYLLDGKPEPTNEGYALAKIAGMKLCEKIFEQYGRCFISCMPTNMYGPNDNFDLATSHVIPALLRRLHEAKLRNEAQVQIWGSGKVRREFLYVDDLAEAVIWLMQNYNEKQFLNVGTGQDIAISELAELIKKIVGYQGELAYNTNNPDGMPQKLLDVERINKLGWSHKIDLEQGLKLAYGWYLKNKV